MEDLIEISDYDPAWPGHFAAEKDSILSRLKGFDAEIAHVGSTAVPGLAAKPTIDLMIGVGELRLTAEQIEAMTDMGYAYLGEYGIPGRHFFRKGTPPTHHVHWVRRDADFWQKQVVFRDYLRANPSEFGEYEAVKKDLAAKFQHDRAAYTSGKTACIKALLKKAWRWTGSPLIVMDLEATCWEVDTRVDRQEIIEIGAVKLDSGLKAVSEFSRFIRPKAEPELSAFCMRLTSIRQQDVNAAAFFPEVFADFAAWAGPAPIRFAAWSGYDLEQLKSDCRRHALDLPAAVESYVDLRQLFARQRGVPLCPMTSALDQLDLTLEGTLHRGIDDARNTSRLAR